MIFLLLLATAKETGAWEIWRRKVVLCFLGLPVEMWFFPCWHTGIAYFPVRDWEEGKDESQQSQLCEDLFFGPSRRMVAKKRRAIPFLVGFTGFLRTRFMFC